MKYEARGLEELHVPLGGGGGGGGRPEPSGIDPMEPWARVAKTGRATSFPLVFLLHVLERVTGQAAEGGVRSDLLRAVSWQNKR